MAIVSLQKLHPSLRRCLQDGVLHHPLIIQPYVERYNALYNRQFEDKRHELRQARATGNWAKVIWLHERPYRANALRKIAAFMSDDQYWRLVGEVWIDAETTFQMRDIWTQIWTAKRPDREQVMTEEEHDALAILPEIAPGNVMIYRGCRDPDSVRGLSWAVSRAQAVWFANRYASPEHIPLLVTAMVNKRNIQAYFVDRRANEAELVVFPKHCQSINVEPLPSHLALTA